VSNKNLFSWRDAILNDAATIEDVIKNLEFTGLQVCLIASMENYLIGIIVDADIRKGLLKGITLSSKASEIMVTKPIVLNEDSDKDVAIDIMQKNGINHVPVLDKNGRVVNLFSRVFEEEVEKKDNLFVIMAGGFGTRLAPYTNTCPKPMLPVNGKPMMRHIIDNAISEGFQNFVISVFYLSEVVKDYFGDGSSLNINITYIQEESPLGTAGALSIINPKPKLPFIVTNGDVMTNIKYSDVLNYHKEKNAEATMVIRRHEIQNPFGVVVLEGVDIKNFEEKPIYQSNVNAGIYALNFTSLDLLKDDEFCNMPTLFNRISSLNKSIIAFPMYENWMDVGNPKDFETINKS
tara:strand:- start:1137 stop:2183 length:1047 start_codon:yes stop_codon:yes gene_type:complete